MVKVDTMSDFKSMAINKGINLYQNMSEIDITNSTLGHDEWKQYDDVLLEVSRVTLNAVNDLINNNLAVSIGNLGTTLSLYERYSDMIDADISMELETLGNDDTMTIDQVGVPIPIIHRDWTIGARRYLASKNGHTKLPTESAYISGKIVAEKIEDMLFNGAPKLDVGGSKLYGYTTFPDRKTLTLAGSGWSIETNRDILGDVEKMIQLGLDNNKRGPFTMYVANNVWVKLQGDYSKNKDKRTFVERIKSYEEISAVKPSPFLANSNVVLAQLTRDVVDLAVAQDMVNIEWEPRGASPTFKVFAALAPRLKSDKNGKCGIIHGSV